MTPTKPSLDLLPALTDEHVLRALLTGRHFTRAELAARTGISKPTVSESVRRLSAAGLIVDTGERTTGRGRVGSYYALSAAAAGCALALSIAPEGVVAETVDAHGRVITRAVQEIHPPARPEQVEEAIVRTVQRVRADTELSIRLAVVSAADPVDRGTGRLVQLPDAPFLVGDLSPVDLLAEFVTGPVLVDNDVNWAARAERDADPSHPVDDVAYLYLGEGLGCAIVSDGEVRRGNSGLAGEIAHLVTTGPDGRAVRFTDTFAVLGLRLPGSTAIDVPALRSTLQGRSARSRDVLAALSTAICGVLSAIVALADPAAVIIGGPWGTIPRMLDAVDAQFRRSPVHVPIRAATITTEPALAGLRPRAVHDLQTAIINSADPRPTGR